MVKGYSSAAQFPCVLVALKTKIIWGDFVHLLSFVKRVKNTCLRSGGRGGCFQSCEHSNCVK